MMSKSGLNLVRLQIYLAEILPFRPPKTPQVEPQKLPRLSPQIAPKLPPNPSWNEPSQGLISMGLQWESHWNGLMRIRACGHTYVHTCAHNARMCMCTCVHMCELVNPTGPLKFKCDNTWIIGVYAPTVFRSKFSEHHLWWQIVLNCGTGMGPGWAKANQSN